MRLGVVQFADLAVFIGAGSVEVAEADIVKVVSTTVSFESIFEGQLGGAVGVYGLAGRLFRDGNLVGHDVDGAGGRENELPHLGIDDSIEQGERSHNVVLKIFSRIGDRFADISVGGKVHDCVNAAQ